MLGKTVGSYRIDALIGQGGMGTVYRAEHTLIGKRAAVKVLRAEYAQSDAVVQRFFNEARAAARIEHSGIIDVYDFGRDGDQAYLVMELLSGQSLSDRLAGGPLEVDTARRLARQIAGALAAAHDHDITHRDLKPDNIFLVPDPDIEGGIRVKLLDFGIAKLTEPDGSASVETRTGSVIGTPLYMSPEQCRGTGQVDHRADLYALGCILYEMLCGRPPFVRKGVGELITAHIMERAERINVRVPGLPEPLAALVMRLLAKSPDQRLASAREVIRALDGDLVLKLPRISAVAPAAHLETLLPGEDEAGGDIGDTESDSPPTPRPGAPGSWSAQTESTDADAQTAEEVALASTTPGRPAQSTLSAAAGARSTATPEPESSGRRGWLVGLALALVGAVGGAGVWIAMTRSGDVNSAVATATPEAQFDAAPPLREPVVGLHHLERFRTATGSTAAQFVLAGGWDSAASDFADAAAQPGAPVRWLAAQRLCEGHAELLRNHPAQGLAAMRQAVAADQAWDLAQLGLARALSASGETEAALEAARRAERLAPDWWRPVAEIADVLRDAGQLDQAVEEYQRALGLAPDEPMLLAALALLYHALHMDSAAMEFADRALALDGDLAGVRLLLAERALEKADGKTALEQAERVLARKPRSVPAKLAQADALLVLRRRDEAKSAYQAVMALVAELGPEGAPAARLAAVEKALARHRLPAPRHRKSNQDRSKKLPSRSNKASNDPLNGLDL